MRQRLIRARTLDYRHKKGGIVLFKERLRRVSAAKERDLYQVGHPCQESEFEDELSWALGQLRCGW